ncbi:hypothetical protein [Rhodococcus opacus]|uniref:hypothetical protein n=1 Tax=Rhodococcus opacus TaxID=37919 RepID=UPI0012FD68D7|nr:hypothetical protein [Rhodococcus opacus]
MTTLPGRFCERVGDHTVENSRRIVIVVAGDFPGARPPGEHAGAHRRSAGQGGTGILRRGTGWAWAPGTDPRTCSGSGGLRT